MTNKSDNILDVIQKIADINFQRDVWVQGKFWHRVIDLTEGINTLEDYEFFEDLRLNKIGLASTELDVVNAFAKRLVEYEVKDADQMLLDKAWLEIVGDAKQTLEILKKYNW